MTFSVNREGGDSDMTSNKTKHPLPHPSRRARKRGSKSEDWKFFKNNYFMKEYEWTTYGDNKNRKIKILIKNNFGNPAPPPVKPTRPNRYGAMLSWNRKIRIPHDRIKISKNRFHRKIGNLKTIPKSINNQYFWKPNLWLQKPDWPAWSDPKYTDYTREYIKKEGVQGRSSIVQSINCITVQKYKSI